MMEKGPKQKFIEIRTIPFNLIIQYHLWIPQNQRKHQEKHQKIQLPYTKTVLQPRKPV